jgi:hypothetical protein
MRSLLALLLLLFATQGVAFAEPPASLDPSAAPVAAEASFRAFARDWMAHVQARGERERANPHLTPGARGVIATYRDVDGSFETELQPTGHPGSPFVGVLRYTENVFNCSDLRATDCHVVSSAPVTEVFRFRDGRWVY